MEFTTFCSLNKEFGDMNFAVDGLTGREFAGGKTPCSRMLRFYQSQASQISAPAECKRGLGKSSNGEEIIIAGVEQAYAETCEGHPKRPAVIMDLPPQHLLTERPIVRF